MLDRLLPRRLDNTYRGYRLGIWLFALVVALKTAQSLAAIFGAHSIAISADGLPVDSFPPAAAQTVVALFALRSLWRLLFCLLCVLALVRYRAAIPLLFMVLAVEYAAAELIVRFLPLGRTGTPPGPMVNLVAFGVSVAGLALALARRDAPGAAGAGAT